MEYTEEMIKTLFERCKQHCLAKYGAEIDYVELRGSLPVGINVYYGREREETEYDISIDDINNTDYDFLIAERQHLEAIKREKEHEEWLKRQALNNEIKEREEYSKYIALKSKFEKE